MIRAHDRRHQIRHDDRAIKMTCCVGQNSVQHGTIAQVQMPIIGARQSDCCAHAHAVTQNTRRFLVQFDGIILPPFVPPAALLQQIWGRLDAGAAYVGTPTLSATDQDVPGHAPKGRAQLA